MGAYLSEPITSKESEDGEGNELKYGASAMQGWRVSQEDAHNCIADFDKNASLFGVYDGHGGSEVAIYLSRHLPEFLKRSDDYKSGQDMKKALHSTYVQIDESIKSKTVQIEIQSIAKNKFDKDEVSVGFDLEEENVGALYEEACMPLEALVAKYHSDNVTPSTTIESEERPCSSKSLLPKRPKHTDVRVSSESNLSEQDNTKEDPPVPEEEDIPKVTFPSHEKADSNSGELQTMEEQPSEKLECIMKYEVEPQPQLTVKTKNNGENNHDAECDNQINMEDLTNARKKVAHESEVVTENGNGHIDDEKEMEQHTICFSSTDNQITEDHKPLKSANKPVNSDFNGDEDCVTVKPFSEKDGTPGEIAFTENATSTGFDVKRVKKSTVYQSLISPVESDSEVSDSDDDSFHVPKHVFNEEDSSASDDDEMNNSETSEEIDEMCEEEEDDSDEDEEDEFLNDVQEPGFDSGATAVVALLKWQADLLHVWVANAGDSRCVISRNGKALDMSKDHKPEEEGEASRIVAAGGKVTADGRVNGGLNLSRALGDHSYKQNSSIPLEQQMITPVPDVEHIVMDPNSDDFIILACDGIWNSLSSQQVVDFVSQKLATESKLSSVCEQLFEACLAHDTTGDGTGCDNMTAVIIRLQKFKNGKRNLSCIESEVQDEPKRIKLDTENSK